MKRYNHPYTSYLAVHLSDGAMTFFKTILAKRKKELYLDRDIRSVNYWRRVKKSN